MTGSAEWLTRGVCPVGHALYGPADLRLRRDGTAGCVRCEDEMVAERNAHAAGAGGLLATLLAERYGRTHQQRRWQLS